MTVRRKLAKLVCTKMRDIPGYADVIKGKPVTASDRAASWHLARFVAGPMRRPPDPKLVRLGRLVCAPMTAAGFDESLHPREHGRFVSTGTQREKTGRVEHEREPVGGKHDPSEQFTRVTGHHAFLAERSSLAAAGVPVEMASDLAQALTGSADVREAATGQTLTFPVSEDVTEREAKEYAAAVGAIVEKYPDHPWNVVIDFPAGHPNASGVTAFPTSMTTISPMMTTGIQRLKSEENFATGWHMPAGEGHTPAEYTAAHEFGHVIDGTKVEYDRENHTPIRSTETNLALDRARHDEVNTSIYGRSSLAECYAEHFAEWTLSNGQTENPVTQNLAKLEGWR